MKSTEARMAEAILEQLQREAPRTRRVLEQVPEGRLDWRPHDKSMPLGVLAGLVAGMPAWLGMIVQTEQLDLDPPGGSGDRPSPPSTHAELIAALDRGVAESEGALRQVSEETLLQPWKLLVGGTVVMEQPRHEVLWDTLMHLSHHRGQLTVYLRLTGATVPSVYGPTADDPRFA